MDKTVSNCANNVKRIVTSFNDEGYISKQEMLALLNKYGKTTVKTINYQRYIGAKIGIHNQQGQKVGKVKSTTNHEFIYITDI